MKYTKLFERGKIGNVEFPNRICIGPMKFSYATGGANKWQHTDRAVRTISSWAKGGAGMIILAHTKVESEVDPEGVFADYVVMDRDDWIRNLWLMTDASHRYGAKMLVQLSAGSGRIASPVPGRLPVGPSENPNLFDPNVLTRPMTISEIERIVESYGQAAHRIQRAGFDGIVVHCLSQLFDQFLSPLWNRRTDKYGGDLDGRMRFVLESIESARSRVGKDFLMIVGMVTNYGVPGGASQEELVEMARRFEKAGVQGFYLRAGGYQAPHWLVPPMYMDDACSVPFAIPIREAVSVPTIADGKIRLPGVAERILEQGQADFICISRPVIADPEWGNKARAGHPEEIRTCIACNECIARLRAWEPLGCSVSPQTGQDWDCEPKPAKRKKKVVVIGGGPGGMQAAMVAAERGHDVILFEREEELGGHLIEAASPSFKKDIRDLTTRLIREINQTSVKIELGKEATAGRVLSMNPDVAIVATGAKALIPDIKGVDRPNVLTALDVLRGKAEAGQEVVILGGNEVGCETAVHLAMMGKSATIVRRGPEARPPDVRPFNAYKLLELVAQYNVKWVTNADVKEITAKGVVVVDRTDKSERTLKADTVLLARGMVADRKVYDELYGKIQEVILIGDAVSPRRIWEAMHEGFNYALDI